jgi:hypothetical protein
MAASLSALLWFDTSTRATDCCSAASWSVMVAATWVACHAHADLSRDRAGEEAHSEAGDSIEELLALSVCYC